MINVVEYRMITSYISEYGLTTDEPENSGCSVSFQALHVQAQGYKSILFSILIKQFLKTQY